MMPCRCQVDEETGPILTPFAATPCDYKELDSGPAFMVRSPLAIFFPFLHDAVKSN